MFSEVRRCGSTPIRPLVRTHLAALPAVSEYRGSLLAAMRSDVPEVRPWQGILLSAPNQVR